LACAGGGKGGQSRKKKVKKGGGRKGQRKKREGRFVIVWGGVKMINRGWDQEKGKRRYGDKGKGETEGKLG